MWPPYTEAKMIVIKTLYVITVENGSPELLYSLYCTSFFFLFTNSHTCTSVGCFQSNIENALNAKDIIMVLAHIVQKLWTYLLSNIAYLHAYAVHVPA